MKQWILPLLLAVAACSPAAEEPVNEAEPAAAEEEAAPVPSLAGEWSVAQINGRDLQAHGMSASFAGDQLTIVSDCVRIAWDYSQDRNIVTFGSPAESGCPGTRTPEEELVQPLISQANIAMFSDNGNEVQISGPGGSITLTRR